MKYVVYREHTLGYLFQYGKGFRALGIFAGSVVRGGHDPKDGYIALGSGQDAHLRHATRKDFEEYRVTLPPDWEDDAKTIFADYVLDLLTGEELELYSHLMAQICNKAVELELVIHEDEDTDANPLRRF